MAEESPESFPASRQVAFHQLLLGARKNWLVDALREALKSVDPRVLKAELAEYVPEDVQTILAASGVRDEQVFPTPVVLQVLPTLIGYYRLVLGVSQKKFYRSGSGMGIFQAMEKRGTMTTAQRERLPAYCLAMAAGLADLIRQISPAVSTRDLFELPLLTLGAQFQGGNNVAIGRQATDDVFLAIAEIVKASITDRTDRKLTVTNASGREVVIALAGDPDVRVQEEFDGALRNKVAIEIKGGTDMSNVHNRVGEAEKSHRKAKDDGFRDFWTIIMTKGVNLEKLHAESPTTNSWFDLAQVLGRSGDDWDEFRSRVAGEVGIPE